MKKFWLILGSIAIVISVWLILGIRAEAVSVETSPVKNREILVNIETSGLIMASGEYNVVIPDDAIIEAVYVTEGQDVESGQKLFKIRDKQLESQIIEAEAVLSLMAGEEAQEASGPADYESISEDIMMAKAALALAQSQGYDYDSFNETMGNLDPKLAEVMDEAVSAGSIQAESLMEALNSNNSNNSNEQTVKKAAEDNLTMLKAKADALTVRSRINGSVLNLGITENSILGAGTSAMVIGDAKNVKIIAGVDERDMGHITEGMEVRITKSTTPDIYYKGTIESVGGVIETIQADQSAMSVGKVTIKPQSNFFGIPGQSVDVAFIVDSIKADKSVSLDCLDEDGNIYVVVDGIAKKRLIETGKRNDFFVEVLSGLEEDDEFIILNPAEEIEDGVKVDMVDKD